MQEQQGVLPINPNPHPGVALQLRTGLVLAQALGRALVLPKLLSGFRAFSNVHPAWATEPVALPLEGLLNMTSVERDWPLHLVMGPHLDIRDHGFIERLLARPGHAQEGGAVQASPVCIRAVKLRRTCDPFFLKVGPPMLMGAHRHCAVLLSDCLLKRLHGLLHAVFDSVRVEFCQLGEEAATCADPASPARVGTSIVRLRAGMNGQELSAALEVRGLRPRSENRSSCSMHLMVYSPVIVQWRAENACCVVSTPLDLER